MQNSKHPAGDAATWPHVDRRKDRITRSIRDIEAQLKMGTQRMDSQDAAIAVNTKLTQQIKQDTSEIVDAFDSLKGAFKVLNMIGRLAKPLGYIVMAASAGLGLVTALKSGSWWK